MIDPRTRALKTVSLFNVSIIFISDGLKVNILTPTAFMQRLLNINVWTPLKASCSRTSALSSTVHNRSLSTLRYNESWRVEDRCTLSRAAAVNRLNQGWQSSARRSVSSLNISSVSSSFSEPCNRSRYLHSMEPLEASTDSITSKNLPSHSKVIWQSSCVPQSIVTTSFVLGGCASTASKPSTCDWHRVVTVFMMRRWLSTKSWLNSFEMNGEKSRLLLVTFELASPPH